MLLADCARLLDIPLQSYREIAATWMVSRWVSAPATTSVDSVKMVVSLLTRSWWGNTPAGRADKTLMRNDQAPD